MSKPLRYRKGGSCPTGKIRYKTAIDAGIALGRAQSARAVKGRDQVVEQRHYRCPTCQGHHLTSKPAAA